MFILPNIYFAELYSTRGYLGGGIITEIKEII